MTNICLTPESYERIERYAEAAGVSLERAASEAIDEWMDSTGDVVMLMAQRRRKQVRKAVPPPRTALQLVHST